MNNRILNIALFMFLSLGMFAQRNSGLNSTSASSANQAADAKAFGISIVKSYFESNCPSVYEKLSSEVTNITDGVKKPKSAVRKTDFCANSPLKDKTTPYTSYTANYAPEVLDNVQFANRYPSLQRLLNLRTGDFYFDGAVLKPGGIQLFNNVDAIKFVVRKNSRGVFEINMIKLP